MVLNDDLLRVFTWQNQRLAKPPGCLREYVSERRHHNQMTCAGSDCTTQKKGRDGRSLADPHGSLARGKGRVGAAMTTGVIKFPPQAIPLAASVGERGNISIERGKTLVPSRGGGRRRRVAGVELGGIGMIRVDKTGQRKTSSQPSDLSLLLRNGLADRLSMINKHGREETVRPLDLLEMALGNFLVVPAPPQTADARSIPMRGPRRQARAMVRSNEPRRGFGAAGQKVCNAGIDVIPVETSAASSPKSGLSVRVEFAEIVKLGTAFHDADEVTGFPRERLRRTRVRQRSAAYAPNMRCISLRLGVIAGGRMREKAPGHGSVPGPLARA
jgi:hypothetical protein